MNLSKQFKDKNIYLLEKGKKITQPQLCLMEAIH